MMNRFGGQILYLIGKGPTNYDYKNLCRTSGPIIFINESANLCEQLNLKGRKEKTFVFAHDTAVKSVIYNNSLYYCVLPKDKGYFERKKYTDQCVGSDGERVSNFSLLYNTRNKFINFKKENVTFDKREIIRDRQWLYTDSGTIHSAICFAWYLGVKEIVLIGCDGINDGRTAYDPRLNKFIESRPLWMYNIIRRVSDQMMKNMHIKFKYRG